MTSVGRADLTDDVRHVALTDEDRHEHLSKDVDVQP